MSFQIIVEFPNEKQANDFCERLEENNDNMSFCMFHPGRPEVVNTGNGLDLIHHTAGDDQGRKIYFVTSVVPLDK
jgi:hypothetical protein